MRYCPVGLRSAARRCFLWPSGGGPLQLESILKSRVWGIIMSVCGAHPHTCVFVRDRVRSKRVHVYLCPTHYLAIVVIFDTFPSIGPDRKKGPGSTSCFFVSVDVAALLLLLPPTHWQHRPDRSFARHHFRVWLRKWASIRGPAPPERTFSLRVPGPVGLPVGSPVVTDGTVPVGLWQLNTIV